VLLPVIVVLSIGYGGLAPMTSDFLRWPSDAVSLIVLDEPREIVDLIHPHPQHIVATLLWLLPDVPCMEDIMFILRVGVVCTSM